MARPRKNLVADVARDISHLAVERQIVTTLPNGDAVRVPPPGFEPAPQPVRTIPEPKPAPSCITCQFRTYNGGYFVCRRYPPPFAILAEGDWCGEYKAKA